MPVVFYGSTTKVSPAASSLLDRGCRGTTELSWRSRAGKDLVRVNDFDAEFWLRRRQ